MKEGNVPCTNTASDPMHSPSAEFTSQRRMGSAGEAKKHPPADVHWIVEGGWGGEGETTAGRAKNEDLVPAQSWTFISFGRGPGAERWRVPCRVRRRCPEGPVPKEAIVTQPVVRNASVVVGRPARFSGLKRQVVGAGFCNGFPLDRGTRSRGRTDPSLASYRRAPLHRPRQGCWINL